MHIFTPTEDLTFHDGTIVLESGEDYFLEDVNTGEFMTYQAGGISVHESYFSRTKWKEFPPNHREMDREAVSTLLIIRPGGFGDLLLLTPTIEILLKEYPNAHISVSCFDRFAPILDHQWQDRVSTVPYPVIARDVRDYDGVFCLEKSVEDENRLHAVDAMAARCNVYLSDNEKTPKYSVTNEERMWVEKQWPRSEKTRVVIQAAASAKCRTYPAELTFDVARRVMHKLGGSVSEILFVGAPGEIPDELWAQGMGYMEKMVNKWDIKSNVHRLTLEDGEERYRPSFRQSAAIVESCDVVFSPDSIMTHMAWALDKPCVAIYGPFDHKLRTKYAPKTRALQGHAPCSPCGWHVRGPREFPPGAPCEEHRVCLAMIDIKSTWAANKVLEHLNKYDLYASRETLDTSTPRDTDHEQRTDESDQSEEGGEVADDAT